MQFKFNISRLLEIEELKDNIQILDSKEAKKYFEWLGNNFSLPYGQINWEKVSDSQTFNIDGLDSSGVFDLLNSFGINKEKLLIGIWSDIDEGIKIKSDLAFKYNDDLWYPVKEDLWLIPEDFSACIEFHHEGYLGFVKLK